MATYASQMWTNYMNQSCALPDYPSAVFSGIVGDAAHQQKNSYHNSIEDNPTEFGYSNSYPDDRVPPGTWPTNLASAGDKSMSTEDMVKEWYRYEAVFYNHNDPRRKYLGEYIGWNGKGKAEKLDFQGNVRTTSSDDHKWHSHRSGRRRYAEDPEFANASLSIEKGQTPDQYVPGASGGSEEDMYAAYGMGLNGSPVSHNTMFLQHSLKLFIDTNDPRLNDHPLTVDGKYGNNTKYWVSVILTGGEGAEVNGAWFSELSRMVASLMGNKEIAGHLVNTQHGGGTLPDEIELVIPGTSIQVPGTTIEIPPTTVTVDVNPV